MMKRVLVSRHSGKLSKFGRHLAGQSDDPGSATCEKQIAAPNALDYP
jgi:hypothetical protein